MKLPLYTFTIILIIASDPASAQQAEPVAKPLFFYDGGVKVEIESAGLAAVKLKEGSTFSSLGLAATTLAPKDPLNSIAKSLERNGMKLLSTDQAQGLSLEAPTAAQVAAIETTIPVVQTISPNEQNVQMMMPRRVLATFTSTMTTEIAIEEYVKNFNLEILKKIDKQTYLLELSSQPGEKTTLSNTETLNAANSLFEKGSADGKVISAHPDFIVPKTRESMDDPRMSQAWHLKNNGQNGAKAGADARVLEAWSLAQIEGSNTVKIAIIDDSVQGSHPDLVDNMSAQVYYDGVMGIDEPNSNPRDPKQRHGTPCAGVAAACANSIGVRGAAPRCTIIGVHFWEASVSQVIEAFRFCEENGASIISCSWSWESPVIFSSLRSTIEDVATNGNGGKGVVILFAAGNNGGEIASHQQFGTLDKVLCVGATNWRDDKSEYSNFGPELDIVAPSSDFVSGALAIDTTDNTDDMPRAAGKTFSGYALGDYTGTGMTGFGGTSSATPLVAGVCGLIISANPALTASQVKDVLLTTTDKDLGEAFPANWVNGHSTFYGYGRVNAARAVERAIQLRTGASPQEENP